jgi:hypothetical protein
MFSKLCNEWERWEPKDKGNGKQALKTWWKKEDVVTKLKNDANDDEETWYDKGGYTANLGVTGTWEHDEDIGDNRKDKKSNDVDDEEGEKEEGEEVESEKEHSSSGGEKSTADVITEQRKSNRQKAKKTK